MRILMVSEDIPARQLGGLGKHAVRLGNALLDNGHGVTLMGRSDVDYAECADEVGFRGPFIGGFHFRHAGWKEQALGVFMPYKRPALAKRIARAILRHAGEFDVVHYHGHLPLVGRYLPEDLNFVQTRHDQGSECLMHVRMLRGEPCREIDPRSCAGCATRQPNALQREITAAAVRQYRGETAEAFSRHKTVFVSGFLQRRFQDVVSRKRPIKACVIHNFIDLRSLPIAAESADDQSVRKRAAIIGRIDEAKGVDRFLSVFSKKSEISVEVDIVGDGPLREQTEKSYSQTRVRFLGWRSTVEAVQLMSRAHFVVVPSVCEESCATTVLEGLALAKPVLALSRGGTPELKRYELWDGQLALFQTMEELVDALIALPPQHQAPQRSFQADVRLMLPELLAAYRAGNGAVEQLSG